MDVLYIFAAQGASKMLAVKIFVELELGIFLHKFSILCLATNMMAGSFVATSVTNMYSTFLDTSSLVDFKLDGQRHNCMSDICQGHFKSAGLLQKTKLL